MEMQHGVTLSQHSTMKLGGPAAYLIEVSDQKSLTEAALNAKHNNMPVMVIGDGSNIIWRDEGYMGLVIVNRIKGFEVSSQDDFGVYITAGAGENLDSVIERTVSMGLSGIECLSLIPGTVGATPVQNVGAYGQEISQTLITVMAFDLNTEQMVTIPAADCGFSYRSSIFKTSAKGRYLITSVTLLLTRNKPMPPFYPAVTNYFEQHAVKDYTCSALRQAVKDIRSAKLPDPNVTANCGSFFHNPVVEPPMLTTLEENYDAVPHWGTDDGKVKLSAAWMIEKAGFNNVYDNETGIATWPGQALVFINRNASTTADLLKFAEKVKAAVKAKFGVVLTMEPELLP